MASRDGEGIFVRDDGAVIPKDILDETELFLDEVHDRCYKVITRQVYNLFQNLWNLLFQRTS